MMSDIDQRAVLERLVRERRDDYANLSRLLGRNAAYIQQFIKRGVPRRLAEADRRTLVKYFNIYDVDLGGPVNDETGRKAQDRLRLIPRLDVGASAGAGALSDGEHAVAHIGFDPAWLKRFCGGALDNLSIIRVRGDSMTPTLSDGDDIMVDRGDAATRLRDGVYVLRRDDALMVKRLAINPSSKRLTIRSDNAAYPTWPECKPASVEIIGRVVWAGRKVS